MSNAIRKIPFVTIFDLSSESKRVQKKKDCINIFWWFQISVLLDWNKIMNHQINLWLNDPKRWERIFTYACDPAARQPCILLTHTLNAWWIRLFKAHLDPREETNSQIFVLKVFGRVIKVVIGRHNVKGLVEQITWISIAQDYI